MSGSTTNTCLTLARQPNAAAMALRASPGTRWRRAIRRLYMPPLAGVAGGGLEERVAAPRDRGEMEHGILLHAPVVTEELAVGAFGLDVAALVEIAFQHPLRVRGNANVVTDALHHRERGIAQARDEPQLVNRQAHHRGDVVGGVRADDEGDRQPSALPHRRLVERAQVGG